MRMALSSEELPGEDSTSDKESIVDFDVTKVDDNSGDVMIIQDYIDNQIRTAQRKEEYKIELDELRFLMKVKGTADNAQIEEDI